MIKFAIIGTNYVTDWFLSGAFRDIRFTLTTIYSRSVETAKNYETKCRSLYGERIGQVSIYTDFEAFASSDTYQAVYLASPNVLHYSQAITLINRGKHVLCEKPLATSLEQTQSMVDTARRNGVALMEAVKTTLLPNFQTVRENLHKIGRIRRYFAQYCQYSGRYDNLKAGIVENAFNPQMAGGSLYDLGIYCIYPMVVLFGKPQSFISEGLMLHTGVDGQGSLICKYDGFDAVNIYSKIAQSFLPSEIQGEDGSIIIDRINTFGSVAIHRRDGSIEDISRVTFAENMYYETAEFINSIENGSYESVVNSYQNSLDAAELMNSIRTKLGIRYPADK